MTAELVMREFNIRHFVVNYMGTSSSAFQLPALRVKGSQWIFGLEKICDALRQKYPIHCRALCPRIAHAPPLSFTTTHDLARKKRTSEMEKYENVRATLIQFLFEKTGDEWNLFDRPGYGRGYGQC